MPQVLGAAGMLSPPDAARLDMLARSVAVASANAAEQDDLLAGVEVGAYTTRTCAVLHCTVLY